MNRFVLEVWDDECRLCTFYTVRKGDPEFQELAELSETDIFFDTYDKHPGYTNANAELLSFLLDSIGEDHGPHPAFFNREENEVYGLPSKGKLRVNSINYHFPQFPLRLYAMKLRDHIVVLFNGGVKDGETNQTSSLESKWKEACLFARAIDKALEDEILVIEEDSWELTAWDHSSPIILET